MQYAALLPGDYAPNGPLPALWISRQSYTEEIISYSFLFLDKDVQANSLILIPYW